MRLIDADELLTAFPIDDEPMLTKSCVRMTIRHMPTIESDVQPVQRWIPCSERLPKDFEVVNVTWVNHDPEPYYDFAKDVPFTATAVCLKGKWYWYSSVCADILAEYGNNPSDEMHSAIEVIAWMPLPEPYKGGEQDAER